MRIHDTQTDEGTFQASGRKRRGAAVVEFALSFLLFLTVFVGVIEFSRAVWTYSTITHAARQGLRFAVTRGNVGAATTDQVSAVVKQNAAGLFAAELKVAVDWADRQRGSIVEVSVDYPFRFVAGALVGATELKFKTTTEAVIHQ